MTTLARAAVGGAQRRPGLPVQ